MKSIEYLTPETEVLMTSMESVVCATTNPRANSSTEDWDVEDLTQ